MTHISRVGVGLRTSRLALYYHVVKVSPIFQAFRLSPGRVPM